MAGVLSPYAGGGWAQTLRNDQLRLQNVDPSILQRFGGRAPSLNETSRELVSPLDAMPRQEGIPPRRPQQLPQDFSVLEEVSRLEADYADRLRVQAPEFADPMLRQFGYRTLGGLSSVELGATGGAINEGYRLGIGDELVITFRGQINESFRTPVDREGQIFLPNMPPLPAAGLTFGQFRSELARQAAAAFPRTDVFVSLGRVRNFPVLVLGQVNQPGVHRLTGMASVFDGIVAAGGVQKSGSLRQVQLIRGGRSYKVDLYDLLLTGQMDEEISLMEGDRVFVPSLGKTIGVAGDVQRPGIYEVNGRVGKLTVAEAVGLAGGTLRPSGYRYLVMSSEDEGGDELIEVDEPKASEVRQGDLVLVAKLGYSWEGAFFLDGHVSVPGPRSLRWDRTVGSVINAPDVLKDDPYLLFAALETTDPVTKARYFVPVDLERIASGKSDVPIRPNDRLIVLGMDDIRFLSSKKVQAVIEGQNPNLVIAGITADQDTLAAERARSATPRTEFTAPADRPSPASMGAGPAGARAYAKAPAAAGTPCQGLHALASVVSRSRTGRFAKARLLLNPETQAAVPYGQPCPKIYDRYPDLLPFILEFVVAAQGAVRIPGVYPVAPGTPVGSLVPVVGGVSPDADLGQIELSRFTDDPEKGTGAATVRQTIDARKTSLSTKALQPGDIVRFNPRFTSRDKGSVFLSGEFRRPGVYTIRRGEKLSEIIGRAGGLTRQAYPLGTVFTRERVRQQEEQSFRRAALEVEAGLAEALASGSISKTDADPNAIVAAVSELAGSLRRAQAVGRVVVESDPTVLDVRPELDTMLEPGDQVHVPKRPNHVTVSGEVLNPGTIQFRAGKSADEYIDAAGGTKNAADDGRIFMILPNGEAQPIQVSSWNYTSVQIPPGSTIVVPRDPKPFDGMAFATTMAEILGKLAVSAVGIAVITK